MGKYVPINPGEKFGRWTVIQRTPGSGGAGQKVYYDCVCECGNTRSVCGVSLRKGVSQSCGCFAAEKASSTKKKDLAGQRFGRLLVIEETEKRVNNKIVWRCKCDCGKEAFIMSTQLLSGKT